MLTVHIKASILFQFKNSNKPSEVNKNIEHVFCTCYGKATWKLQIFSKLHIAKRLVGETTANFRPEFFYSVENKPSPC